MIRPEPVDQQLDIELCRLAAHRVTAIDVHRFASGQSVGERRTASGKGPPPDNDGGSLCGCSGSDCRAESELPLSATGSSLAHKKARHHEAAGQGLMECWDQPASDQRAAVGLVANYKRGMTLSAAAISEGRRPARCPIFKGPVLG